jgi:hypothetical protein
MTVITPMDSNEDEGQQWERVLHAVAVMMILCMSGLREPGEPCRTSALSGYAYVQELLNGHACWFKEVARMNHDTFHSICGDLREVGLEDTLGLLLKRHSSFSSLLLVELLETVRHRNVSNTVERQFIGKTSDYHY